MSELRTKNTAILFALLKIMDEESSSLVIYKIYTPTLKHKALCSRYRFES